MNKYERYKANKRKGYRGIRGLVVGGRVELSRDSGYSWIITKVVPAFADNYVWNIGHYHFDSEGKHIYHPDVILIRELINE